MTEDEFSKVPDARVRFLALTRGSEDESAKNVAADEVDDFYAQLTFNTQWLSKHYGTICREYGGSSIDDVPENRRNACKLALWDWQAHFANRCLLELDVERARHAYDEEVAAPMDFG